MLKSLKIRNFQAFRSLDIKFSPTITTIVGPTDKGKSSVVRLLRWICLNVPSGTAFIRDKRKTCSGKLVLDDATVTRSRSKSSNKYTLNGHAFKALKTGSVPEEISNVLKISADNFQLQHDQPFWIAKSPGQVSKDLNRIVDLKIIDNSLKNVATICRKAQAEEDVLRKQRNEARSRARELAWVLEAREALKKPIRNVDEVHITKYKRDHIQQLIEEYETAKRICRIAKSAVRKADRINDLVSQEQQLKAKHKQILSVIKQHDERERELCQKRKLLEQAERELAKLQKGRCPICKRSLAKTKLSPSQ